MDASSALVDVETGGSRELSPGERWYWIIDQLSTLNVCARVRIEGEVRAGALRAALGALQDRHPLLRTAITDPDSDPAGGGPRFVAAGGAIALREVRLDRAEDERWVREVDGHELCVALDWRSGPLARAVWISAPRGVHDLLLTVPHCIADGTTALALLRQWVTLAAAPEPGFAQVAVGGLPEPFEALFPHPFRTAAPADQQTDQPAADGGQAAEVPAADGGQAAEVQADGGPVGGVGRLEPERFVPFGQRRTRMLHRSLSGAQLEALTAACRRQGASLHGVLAAALACAVARDAGAAPSQRFAVGSPVSLREELARVVGEDEVGCFVSALHSVVECRREDLWSTARFVRDDIAARKKAGEQYEVFGWLAAQGPAGVGDSEPFIRHFEENGPFNFFVSNIGRFEFPTALEGWRLSGAQFVGGISVVGYLGSSVTTSQGQLSWNFTHIDRAVSRERAERLADDAVALVVAAAQ